MCDSGMCLLGYLYLTVSSSYILLDLLLLRKANSIYADPYALLGPLP
jgi:hypothetical protein